MKVWAVSLGLWALSSTAQTQSPEPRAQSLTVFLVTIGQGAVYWEKYGHNMLWFSHPAAGVDVAYNWGMFDFAQPGFLRRQLLGDPQYSVVGFPGQDILAQYRNADRTITLQELNLTPAQAQAALERARWNAREENKFYRYDYYRDNCSTRVRDLIDYAVGGTLKPATQDTVDRSYRGETLRLLDDMNFTQLGTHVALGRPADRRLTLWEDMFIPMRLRDGLRGLQVRDSAGATRPIVLREQVLYESQSQRERATTPVLWVPYLIVGVLLAAELLVMGFVGRRSPVVEKIFRIEVAAWALMSGLLGAILLGAWTATEHVFWYNNENLLLLNPIALFLGALALRSLWKPTLVRPAAVIAIVIALTGAVAIAMKGLPWSQQNVALIALLVPAHFVVAFHLWRRAGESMATVPR